MANLAVNLALGFATNFLLGMFAPTQKSEGPRLSDLNSPKSSYGSSIPKVYGSVRVSGNVVWSKPIKEVATTQKQGGKGGGGVENTSYSYFGSFAALLCQGGIESLERIWLNNKLVWDRSGSESASLFENYFRFYSGTSDQPIDPLIAADKLDNAIAYRNRAYLVFEDLPLGDYGNRLPAVSVEVKAHSQINLGQVVRDICSEVGLSPADLETTEIDNIPVTGFWVQNLGARDAIAQLQKAYFFNVIESLGRIKFIRQQRPSDQITNISRDDLASHESGTTRPDLFKEIRTQETELPDKVSVTYLDKDFAYQQSIQYAERSNSPNKNALDIKLDIVLTASEALTIAQRTLFLEWARRRKYSFNLPLKYLFLEPGDLIRVNFHNINPYLTTLTKLNVGANFLLECESEFYDAEILDKEFTSNNPVADLTLKNPSDTELQILDIPLIRDSDDGLGVYVAATGANGWRNANLFVSRNGGNGYEFAKTLLTKTTQGFCNAALQPAQEFLIDLHSNVEVTDLNGELESISDLDFHNGKNIALIGDEIIYFKSAVLTAPATYTLSHFLRGRRGTEWAITGHTEGERFILLSEYLERIPGQSLDLKQNRLYKAPRPNQALQDVLGQSFTSLGISQKPYAPCQITYSASSNDFVINWVRRTRINGDLLDFSDVPLGETQEAYIVEVVELGQTIRRESVSEANYLYSESKQLADFGELKTTYNIRICQFSPQVGDGYFTNLILER